MSNRIIYPAQAAFVGPSPATGAQPSGQLRQLVRVQTVSHDWSVSREDVSELGAFGAIDQVIVAPPTVPSDFTYISTSVRNESGIGLYVGGDYSVLKNILDGSQRDKNYFLRIVPEGYSAGGYAGTDGGVISIGNANISSYKAEGKIGSFPTVSVSLNALNLTYNNHSDNIDSPAINPQNGVGIAQTTSIPQAGTGLNGQISALQPGDITVDISSSAFGISGLSIQSYDLGFDLNLEPQEELGYKFPRSYDPQFPINCTMTVEANVRDIGTGNLATFLCEDPSYDLSVTLREPACGGATGDIKVKYTLKGAKLDGQDNRTSIGPNKSVTLKYSCPITGPNEQTRGLYISGSIN
jgi:hypothetical protein